MNGSRGFRLLIVSVCALGLVVATLGASQPASGRAAAPAKPIQHVVVVLLENHSFDNVLGPWCARSRRCNGIDIGDSVTMDDGRSYRITRSPDFVPGLGHSRQDQDAAWNRGWNNGWLRVVNCGLTSGHACLGAYAPSQVPNIVALARRYAVSDNTRTCERVPSWAAHVQWFTGCELGGFHGDVVPRKRPESPPGVGWGCDSGSLTAWGPRVDPLEVPSCFPDYGVAPSLLPPEWDPTAGGAWRKTPVRPIKTLGDACNAKPGCTWTLYGSTREGWNETLDSGERDHGYLWNISVPFAQHAFPVAAQHTKPADGFIRDARLGRLPAISFLLPMVSSGNNSQHNKSSMAFGDNVLGQQMAALTAGPQWRNTAVFITYDDCGCFYDHVSPERVPMVIVSPWVRPGHTDSNRTTFAGVQRFINQRFGLPAVSERAKTDYDYRETFDFSSPPRLGEPFVPIRQEVPASSRRLIATTPVDLEELL